MPDESARLAGLAAALLAIAPRLGGALLVGGEAGQLRDWIEHLRALRGATAPHRRVPLGVTSAGLLGGTDITTSLASGRRVVSKGVLAAAHGGVLSIPLVELQDSTVVSMIGVAVDEQQVRVERDGVSDVQDADVVIAAMTAGGGHVDAERPSASLLDRLALTIELPAAWPTTWHVATSEGVQQARERAATITVEPAAASALCAAAAQLGIASLRAVQHAVRLARAHAALCGRSQLNAGDLELAIALVLAPRGSRGVPEPMPHASTEPAAASEPPPSDEAASGGDAAPSQSQDETPGAEDMDIGAIDAILSADFIRNVARRMAVARRASERGRSGRRHTGLRRGRPIGSRPGDPRRGVVDLHATLLAACPRSAARARNAPLGDRPRPSVRPDDIRIRRFVEPTLRTIVFAVDASGSLARSRLAEAKGAIELLLAASYSRRDRACLISFRGTSATCVLPPTRALARARRELAAMAGGGGTPLASGLDLAREICERIRREAGDVRLVVVTDGGANIARNGDAGRVAAAADATDAGQRLRRLLVETLVIDASPRGSDAAISLANLIGARHLHLGRTDARRLHAAVQSALGTAVPVS